jgi:ArsR family metal-binding transcriptional regulator
MQGGGIPILMFDGRRSFSYSPRRSTRTSACRLDVFALLVPSCCDKSGTSCYHLVTRLMKVTDSCSNKTNTHVKISHLAASLPTSCVHTACPKLSTSLLTSCNNLVDIIRLVARLFQQVCYKSWYDNIVTTLCGQLCSILVISWLYQTC